MPGTDLELPALKFPFQDSPRPGELIEITPDVRWLRLPMPFGLDHVNLYLVRVEAGWVIVDTGLDSPETRDIWEGIFSGPMQGEPMAGVLSTHFHVDHCGLAGYLTERRRLPLLMSYREYFTMRGWPGDLAEVPWQHAEFYRKGGCGEEVARIGRLMFNFAKLLSPPPPSFLCLRDGEPLPVFGGAWRIIMGEGHSPEQAMLFSADDAILISGDQLLPTITTNVSVSVINPEDDPLGRWFASLDRLAELPADILVLPAHGAPFYGIKTRVAELRAHHEEQLQVVLDLCATRPASLFEITQAMFPYPSTDFDQILAIGESLAHIRYLVSHGRLECSPDKSGVLYYRGGSGDLSV
ncbi:MAG: MBL fold metallo-hydrolase [Deltaproteobacteria bacterium]|nr:MBL fold metallo-hydrolase [Deltaproteobacteria bacterium]